jgi:hypothetical protein
MRFPTAKTIIPGRMSAAVAIGKTVRRSIWIKIIHSTMMPPTAQPILAISAPSAPPASNIGSRRNWYTNAPAVKVTRTVSRISSGSARRVGCPRNSVVTPSAKQTLMLRYPTSASEGNVAGAPSRTL